MYDPLPNSFTFLYPNDFTMFALHTPKKTVVESKKIAFESIFMIWNPNLLWTWEMYYEATTKGFEGTER